MTGPEESAEVLTALLLFALDGFRLLIIVVAAWFIVPRHRACPACGEPTELLQGSRGLRWVLLEKRWCLKCGWTGIARKLPATPETGKPAAAPGKDVPNS